MQFSTKEDIEAPIADVFAMLAEFESYERAAIRRGVEVQRLNENAPRAAGLTWKAAFTLRGKPRRLNLVLSQFDPPNLMRFDAEGAGLDGHLTIELMALSPKRTRMAIVLNLAPKTLSARLFVQSLKLAKSNLSKRFKLKVAEHAKALEERYTRSA